MKILNGQVQEYFRLQYTCIKSYSMLVKNEKSLWRKYFPIFLNSTVLLQFIIFISYFFIVSKPLCAKKIVPSNSPFLNVLIICVKHLLRLYTDPYLIHLSFQITYENKFFKSCTHLCLCVKKERWSVKIIFLYLGYYTKDVELICAVV